MNLANIKWTIFRRRPVTADVPAEPATPSRDVVSHAGGSTPVLSGYERIMSHTVFFAWQLDAPSEHNKKFIWDAILLATSDAAIGATPESSPRPESDTQGVPGSPNIVSTIFSRIRECAIFIADLTLVAKTESGKKSPNPNVAIELGYAARSIGWDRTILVMNNAFGSASELPFDILQHRWPIEYRITGQTQVGAKRFDQLTDALTEAIRDCERHSLERARDMANMLDTDTIDFIARHEESNYIDLPLPPKTMGQQLVGLGSIASVRKLIEIGALRVTNKPNIGYAWTYDGRRMVDAVREIHGDLLDKWRLIARQQENAE